MDELAGLGDHELCARLAQGDEAAFTALYRRRQGTVYRFVLHMSGSPAMAEEVTQEVFITLMESAAKLTPERGAVTSYLFGVARHKLLRALARDRAGLVSAAPDEARNGDAEPAAADNTLESLLEGERAGAVRQAILSLPEAYREVAVLCELEELSYAEAGELLGCPPGTVRSRLHRARALLAEKLRARLGGQGVQVGVR